ncbi:hypothetical protein CsSME_00026399 [Camellia sinensis var. sinensis]
MINLKPPEARLAAASMPPLMVEKAFLFISRGWKEVKDFADADLQLMKDKAISFKNMASSFDRELKNFLNLASRSTFSVPAIRSLPLAKIDFVKQLHQLFQNQML